MIFLGKWTLAQGDNVVQIDPATGSLKLAAAPTDGSGRFNAYGTTAAFVLQGGNGKYIVASGTGYAATADLPAAGNQFTLVTAAGSTRVLDLGPNGQGASQFYWNAPGGGVLQALAKTDAPPVTTNFTWAVVTVGLSTILSQGFQTPQPDLTWVNLSGTDFTQAQGILDFTQATLTNADLSNTKFEQGIGFDSMTAQYANFTSAVLAGASMGNAHLEHANFTNAVLTGADVSGTFFNNATLDGIHLNQQSNLYGTHFNGATMQGADLTNSGNIDLTDFSGANLTGARFTGASVTGAMTINDANLTRAALNNAWYWLITDGASSYVIIQGYGQAWYGKSLGVAAGTNYNAKSQFFIPRAYKDVLQTGPVVASVDDAFQQYGGVKLTASAVVAQKQFVTIYPKQIVLNSNTNFTGANLQCIDFRGYDLSHMILSHADFGGAQLDNVNLTGADMSYGDFTGVTFTGGVPMFGATLSNAIFTNADMTSVQMGAIGLLFSVAEGSGADYQKLLTALTGNIPANVTAVFADNHVTLTSPTIIPSVFAPGRVWDIQDGQQSYTVRLVPIAGGSSLQVSQPTTPAVLTNASMRGATLTAANLYQVRASGIQLYGGARLDGNAIVEGAQFNNGNLANINLMQAALYGVNFDYCILNNANFSGAHLTPSSTGGQASFNSANLQGTVFSDAQLANAIFTDAAVSVALPSSSQPAGVWLFDAPAQNAGLLQAELTTAANPKFNFPLDIQASNLLKPGPVAAPVAKIFQQHGISLGSTALVSVMGEGPYWVVADGATSYVIFESCDQNNYTPALAVATGTSPIVPAQFFIAYSLESDLQPGAVRPSVVSAFKNAGGITLGAAATVSVQQQYTDWQIADVGGNYSLWLGLSKSCVLQITVAPTTPALQQLFTNYSTPLSRRATVSSNKSTNVWSINNDSDNPFNPIVNYIDFNIVLNPQGGLDVYGSKLRIRRLAGGDQQEYQNISCEVTVLGEHDLVDSTTCPNSMTVSSNKTDQLPIDQWMRARVLPRAPLCVPSGDGTYYCPR